MSVILKGIVAVLCCAGLACLLPGVYANPDEGPGVFIRGDTNNDGGNDISDAVFILGYLFLGGPTPVCPEGADVNDDDHNDISDAVYILNYMFLGKSAPPSPFPSCDVDPGGRTCPASICNGPGSG